MMSNVFTLTMRKLVSLTLRFGVFVALLGLHGAAAAIDTEYLAKLLWQAKQRGDYLPDIYRLNPNVTETDLYAVQRYFVSQHLEQPNSGIAGFKGGFIPQAPVGGVLYQQGVMRAPGRTALDDFTMLIVEAEIGFKFCEDIDEKIADVDVLKSKVCALMPVMEIADGAIADFAQVRKNFDHLRKVLISMNVASAGILLGPERPTDIDVDQLAVSMTHGQEVIGSRDLSKPADLWRNVLWVVNEFVLEQGYRIAAGQLVIPGNLTGIHRATTGRYRADFGALGSLTLTVE